MSILADYFYLVQVISAVVCMLSICMSTARIQEYGIKSARRYIIIAVVGLLATIIYGQLHEFIRATW